MASAANVAAAAEEAEAATAYSFPSATDVPVASEGVINSENAALGPEAVEMKASEEEAPDVGGATFEDEAE